MGDFINWTNWAKRASESLRPRSKESSNLKVMLSEWYYNGETIDFEIPCESCELCGHQGLRYQFGITNRITDNELLVGSECITRFDLTGIGENGEFIDAEKTRKRVHKDRTNLIKEARLKRTLNCILLLQEKDSEIDFKSTVEKFRERGAFSPNHLAFILWRMKKNKISYNAKDFKVSLRRNREKDQLENLKDWQKKLIEPCLTSTQKRTFIF